MEGVLSFVQAHKPYFELAQAFSSVINLFAWLFALLLLAIALRKNRIESLAVGPFSFRMMKEEAVVATASASRAWQARAGEKVDVPRIRATIDRAFTPETLDNLTGKAILWVDDNPANNELAARALRKFGLDIEQATSTEDGMAAFRRRKFDLVISDMGRGTDMRAGYALLKLLRDSGSKVPFFIFAGSDTPEFRREAAERGAQLSTDNMLELVDYVVKYLGEAP
ncbi:MAG: response regulator [Bradyrhizobiaceae bacterium]|nr:response regulator [Bradyrhizobiaceae bacterium]